MERSEIAGLTARPAPDFASLIRATLADLRADVKRPELITLVACGQREAADNK
jgi:hypothetical protein